MVNEKRGQIWVETVIYTMIMMLMIGAVLAFARPKIQETQDKLIIDNTLEMMQEIDSEISSIARGGSGNKRTISIEIEKGELEINKDDNNMIIFRLKESKSTYSEPGATDGTWGGNITIGNVIVKTKKIGKVNEVELKLDYSGEEGYNLEYEGNNILSKSPSPYELSITNKGISIEIKLVS